MSRVLRSLFVVPGLIAAVLLLAWESPADARRCPPGWYRSHGACVRAGSRVGRAHHVGRVRGGVVSGRHVGRVHRRGAVAGGVVGGTCRAGYHRGAYGRCVRNGAPYVRNGRVRNGRCRVGYHRDAYGRCVRNGAPYVRNGRVRKGRCRVGYHRDAYGRCVRNGAPYVRNGRCRVGYHRDAYGRCVRNGVVGAVGVVGAAVGGSRCSAGWRWSPYYRRCVRTRITTCPPGTHWNGYTCRTWRRCPTGQYWSPTFHACRAAYRSCPYGYHYRPGWGCQRICPTGWFFSGGTCQKTTSVCPTGTYWSASLGRCRPACGPGLYWSYRQQRCRRIRW